MAERPCLGGLRLEVRAAREGDEYGDEPVVVAAEVEDYDLALARGNVLGRHGPRAAVAVGLVLAFAQGGARA